MACGLDDNRDISDPWRVSCLIRAVVELVSAFCVLLCAILSVTTIKVVKASKLFPSFVSSCELQEVHGGGSGTQDVVIVANGSRRKQRLQFCEQQASNSYSFEICKSPTPLTIRCEGCALALCDCACSWERRTVIDRKDTDHTEPNVVGVINTIHSNHEPLIGDCTISGHQNQQYFESDVFGIEPTSACACQGCDSNSDGGNSRTASTDDISPFSPGAALESKVENVVLNESEISTCSNTSTEFDEVCILNVRSDAVKGSEDGRRGQGIGLQTDRDVSSSSQLPSEGRFRPEDSPRDSSQESFLYSRRSSAAAALLTKIGNGDHISIDSDLLCGGVDTTFEQDESLGSASPEIERETEGEEEGSSSGTHAGGDNLQMQSVMELRKALQQEQEALASVYEELEEERSASCSAALEAMAMINRLQEEKAAVQMEARQYQRMAEEKELYDQEALAMLQEILDKREDEVYALEEEVDSYRKRLLSPGRGAEGDQSEANIEDSSDGKSPARMRNDVLGVEPDATDMERSEVNRTMRSDSLLDEKLVAEIKDWLFAAREKGVPAKVEDLDVPGSVWREASIGNFRVDGDGRKNLLDSFRSVASAASAVSEEEDCRRDDATMVIEEALDTYKEAPAVSNAFQSMMESLRQQPSLRDEESLATLTKIEEKFQRQSSIEKARSEEELRRVWKSTLRSFERGDAAEVGGETAVETALFRAALSSSTTAQRPASILEESTTNDICNTEPVRISEVDRTTEEKRLSVLEYVEKFEEQLHQQQLVRSKAKPLLSAKSGMPVPPSSVVEGEWNDAHAAAWEFSDSDKKQKPSSIAGDGDSSGSRPSLVKSRLRKLAAGARNVALKAKRDSLKAISRQPSGNGYDVVDGRHEGGIEGGSNNLRHERGECPSHGDNTNAIEGSTGSSTHESFHDSTTTFTDRRESGGDRQKSVHNFVTYPTSEPVRRVVADSDENAHCTEEFRADDGEEQQSWSQSRDMFHVGNSCDKTEANGDANSENFMQPSGNVSDSLQSRAATIAVPLSSAVAGSNSTADAAAEIDDVVRQLTDRLKSLEDDRQVMQDTITALRKENGEMKFVQEIAQQLSEFRGVDQSGWSSSLDSWPSDNPSAKGTASVNDLRHTVRSQLMSKVAHLFLGNGDDPGGASPGDQKEHVGLCRLLHRSPLSNQGKPFDRARSFKATSAGFPSSGSLFDTAGVHGQAYSKLNTALSLPAALLAYGRQEKIRNGVEGVDRNH